MVMKYLPVEEPGGSRKKPPAEPVEAEQAQPEDCPPPTGEEDMSNGNPNSDVAAFRATVSVTIGKDVQATTEFAEYVIPVEIIREYRTFVETGFAAVLAKAAIVILGSGDATGLMAATPAAVQNILGE